MRVNVVGFDPAFRNWAFVYGTVDLNSLQYQINEAELVTTEKADGRKGVRVTSDDLKNSRILSDAVDTAVNKADMVITEVPGGSKSASAIKGFGICIGVLGQIDEAAIPVIEVTAKEAKKAATGKLNATKYEVIAWAYANYPDLPWKIMKVNAKTKTEGRPVNKDGEILHDDNEHVADAIAVVEAGLQTKQFKELRAMLLTYNKSD